jgi:trans-aconitate 2-methyltransferase
VADWDARTYHRVSDPLVALGERVLDRLPLRGDEVVLDAGCGSGKVTRLLLDRLPRGRVYGVDFSPSMLAVAAEQLASYGDRVRLLEGDLTSVRLPEPVDAIFSNATFHWVPDHPALFRNLHSLLAPGGALVAQCGGAGNIQRVMECAETVLGHEPFASQAAPQVQTWRFASAEETLDLLRAAGFEGAEAWLQPEPTPFPDRDAYATYMTTVVLRPYLARLPEALHSEYVHAYVAEAERSGLGHQVDYVRLNLAGRRLQ